MLDRNYIETVEKEFDKYMRNKYERESGNLVRNTSSDSEESPESHKPFWDLLAAIKQGDHKQMALKIDDLRRDLGSLRQNLPNRFQLIDEELNVRGLQAHCAWQFVKHQRKQIFRLKVAIALAYLPWLVLAYFAFMPANQ